MGTPGRPSKYSDPIREKILQLLKEGKTEAEVAQVIGICPKTLSNWKGRHAELLHAVNESKLAADELVEIALFRRATGYAHPETKVFMHEGCPVTEEVTKHYAPDSTAIMFWLRNRQPEKWREKADGADVNVHNNVNTSQLTDEQLDARIAALMAKAQPAPAPLETPLAQEDAPEEHA